MLKKTVKYFLNSVPQCCGLLRFFRKTILKDRLAIICYHMVLEKPLPFPSWISINIDSFRRQMAYLKDHFDLLPLQEGVEKCLNNELIRPAAVITFDDGFYCNFTTAFPLLKELNIPSTIFLSTDFIDTNKVPWFSRLDEALARSPLSSFIWEGKRFTLTSTRSKKNTSRILQALLKQLPHKKLAKELNGIIRSLGDNPYRPFGKNSPFHMLDSASISDMLDSGLVSFGAHTHSHSILSLLPKNKQKKQITRSLNKVETLTGKRCSVFAYPNGRKQDYTQDTIDILSQCGINIAVTGTGGYNGTKTNPLELKRVSVGGSWDMGVFQFAVHSGLSWYS